MRFVFVVLLALHAVIHLMGFAKAFALAPLTQLAIAISRPMGLVWLAAAALLFAAAVVFLAAPRWFWLVGLAGVAVSQVAIVASWGDARFGTLANAAVLLAAVYGAFAWGPFGLRAEYERLVRSGLEQAARSSRPEPITEADLSALPPVVQRYLRFAGVPGTPPVHGFRARLAGRIRGSATAPWMPFVAEQTNFYDPPRRYFWMEATRGGLPVVGLHAYDLAGATMRIRLLSMIPIVSLDGPQITRTETVTLLNDMSIFAPARLLDPAIRWHELDGNSAEATYTHGAHTVRAVLIFNDSGALTDFRSDDRPALAEDGKSTLPQRWSTPVSNYRTMGPYNLAARGEGRYAAPDGEYAYLEIEILEVTTDLVPHNETRR